MTKSKLRRVTVRLANMPGDDQLIVDLFRKFPQQGPRRSIDLPIDQMETLLVFDDKQESLGTCRLSIAQNLDEQHAQLGARVIEEGDSLPAFPKLVVGNVCSESPQVGKILLLVCLRIAHGLHFNGTAVTGILCMHTNPADDVVDLRRDGYVLRRVSEHHPSFRVASSLSRAAFLIALTRAADRLEMGDMPIDDWEGLPPFRSRYPGSANSR